VSVPLIDEVMARSPKAICQLAPTGGSTNLIVNHRRSPFDNQRLRKAMTLAIDRQGIIDIVSAGKASISGAMMPLPEGGWGMPTEMLMALPGYGGDLAERRTLARKIMASLGYGPEKRLKVKVTTRDFQTFKDPAVLVVDQLNQIYFDAELEIIESAVWYSRVIKHDYSIGLNLKGSGVDDPDINLVENYSCQSERNYTSYCNPEVENLIERQSRETEVAARKAIVWQIERILADDAARPIIMHNRAATCWHPHVKGHVLHENAMYNNWRFENVWLNK
jgi:peptide/nickel transport system substrate-binding protein